jgi:hypothetical protein
LVSNEKYKFGIPSIDFVYEVQPAEFVAINGGREMPRNKRIYLLEIFFVMGSFFLTLKCKPRLGDNASVVSKATSTSDAAPMVRFEETAVGRFLAFANKLEAQSVYDLLDQSGSSWIKGSVRLNNPVFVYNSRSAHSEDVTPQAPRVLALLENQAVAAFTTDSTKESSHLLEFLQLEGTSWKPYVVKRQADKWIVSPSSETQSCSGCHGSAIRPIWATYPLWPGIFQGVRSNSLSTHEQNLLKEGVCGSSRPAVLRASTIKHNVDQLCENANKDQSKKMFSADILQFSQGVANINFKRIANILRSNKQFEKLKFVIFGAGLSCSNLESFFPKRISSKIAIPFKTYQNDMKRMARTEFETRVNDYKNLAKASIHETSPDSWAFWAMDIEWEVKLGYLFEAIIEPLLWHDLNSEFKFSNWTLNFNPGEEVGHGFTTPNMFVRDFLENNLCDNEVCTKDLKNSLAIPRSLHSLTEFRLCTELQTASLEALSNLE